ncbi:class I SAM-dependent methyltransferase [Loktanella sp. SALINAS62]|uniref:class I SAM-dependent methyltransferase n=1 Tax=Loktanella sp. SALINAS62 TaxID=2706124 RepID=UPI001B8C6C08|nr:class I SAM-dependent methyltransferase [Loktanella sp. SALINAS62]MBS1301309.1 class I SAM-dependent methyltransferase [Loktanella sp. SALINAS62]
MHLDVLDLRSFYYRSTLGRAAQRVVRNELVQIWPEAKGQTVAGFGFAVPLLRPYLADARRVIGLMPGPQGVMPWPPGEKNVSVLCEDTSWPLPTGIVDKLVVMHGLETSQKPELLLAECYRVLGPGGRAVFIVPNRAGMWARSDRTPFGFGRPYLPGQLEDQLRAHDFTVRHATAALYQLPSQKPIWRKSAAFLEKAGHKIPMLAGGGVLIVEAAKAKAAMPGGGSVVKTTAGAPASVPQAAPA